VIVRLRVIAVLSVTDVHTYYGDSHVLQGVTMRVDRGTVAAVLGRNGVGKTTLCRSIVGFTPARSGRIVFNDVETTRLPPHRISALRIGLVPQGRRIFSSLTVDDVVHVMSKGTIVNSSDPAALWANEEIKAQYLGVPKATSLH